MTIDVEFNRIPLLSSFPLFLYTPSAPVAPKNEATFFFQDAG